MNRMTILALSALAAASAAAQQPTQPAPTAPKPSPIVASINSETLTLDRLNELYYAMPQQLLEQYERSGGKAAFLDNYVKKRLLIQEALKSSFDRRPDVLRAIEAARETTIFDRYVRDVVAATVVNEAMLLNYYEANQKEFERAEQVKARHIIVSFGGQSGKTKEDAQKQADRIYQTLKQRVDAAPAAEKQAVLLREFEAAARTFSEDGVAKQGGDLGWFGRNVMDPAFEKVVWETEPGTISRPFETTYGFHIAMVEVKRPAGVAPFDEVRGAIRERVLALNGAVILEQVAKLSNELRNTGNVAVFPENVK